MLDWKKIRDTERKLNDSYRVAIYIDDGDSAERRDEYRATNFPHLLQALEDQEKRSEFLEKALEQARCAFDITIKDNSDERWVEAGCDQPYWEAFERCYPELAEYLEEKNG